MPIRPNKLSDFIDLPEVPTGYPLPPYFGLVVPIGEDRENLITNPSFELDLINWAQGGGAASSRTTTEQYVGAYSMQVNTSGASSMVYGGATPLSLTSGANYAASMRFFCPIGGLPYDFYVATTGLVRLSGIKFRSTGFWQWITFIYNEASTTSRDLIIATDGIMAQGKTFYVDAVQFELTSAGKRYPTTYIDGDQFGLTPNEFPLPYYWTGTPHASSSIRSGLTRSGGQVVNLKDMGLILAVVTGLGLVTPQHATLPLGQLDGEIYQRTRKQSRIFSLAGRVTQRSAILLDQSFSSLSSILDIDASPRQEPFIMKYTPLDEQEVQIGPELDIIATYEGGLEGQRNNLNTETFTATFKQYLPLLLGHSEGGTLSNSLSVTNANSAIRRKSDGTWASVSTGFTGGLARIVALARHPNGTIYWGGDFTDAGGSGADYAAIYNPVTNALSVVKSATAFNAEVQVITVGPDGSVYFGGNFTNVDGIANADGIVKYNPVTNTFSALGTGVAAGGDVWAIAFDSAGNLYAGGLFTLMGGVANTVNVAKWNGTVWSALSTGTNDRVHTILAISSTEVYIGGNFTLAGGVANTIRIAKFNGTVFSALGTGANAVLRHIRKAPSGLLYVVGAFTTLDGRSIQYIGTWNGVTFQPVGSPSAVFSDTIQGIDFKPNGTFIVVGEFGSVNGVSYPSQIAEFDGVGFSPISVQLPSGPVFDVIIMPDGTLYFGFNATGTATAEVTTTVTNTGTGKAYPFIKVTGPSSGSSTLYSIRNITTGKSLFFFYAIQAGETITMNLDPQNLSFNSDFYGDISYAVLIGSNDADFYLSKGSNKIALLATSTPTFVVYWDQPFLSASDAVGKT